MSIEDRINQQRREAVQQKEAEEKFWERVENLAKLKVQSFDSLLQILDPIITQNLLDLFKFKFDSSISPANKIENRNLALFFEKNDEITFELLQVSRQYEFLWHHLDEEGKFLALKAGISEENWRWKDKKHFKENVYFWIVRYKFMYCDYKYSEVPCFYGFCVKFYVEINENKIKVPGYGSLKLTCIEEFTQKFEILMLKVNPDFYCFSNEDTEFTLLNSLTEVRFVKDRYGLGYDSTKRFKSITSRIINS
jgi:hypothetical protein